MEAIKNLIIISDTHAGCQLGLCPPEGAKLDEGGTYMPNKIQREIWEHWLDFWDNWVPQVTHGEPYAVLLNGDAIDNEHHGSSHQWSHNTKDQRRCAERILWPVREKASEMFFTRGTSVHDGESGREIEELARDLRATPNDSGQYARHDIRIRVGKALVHALHHIGTTGSSAHEASAVNSELTASYVDAARWGYEPPDYVVRSHRHRAIVVDLDAAGGYAAGIVTPGWQGKTPFAFRVPGGRVTTPQWGGFCIRQGDEEHYYRRKVYSIEPSKEVVLCVPTNGLPKSKNSKRRHADSRRANLRNVRARASRRRVRSSSKA